MVSPSSSSSRPPGRRDRLSDLPDLVLGNILSYLPNKEAARAAALSCRWRNIFCNLHTVSFQEREGARANDWSSFYYEAHERKSPSWALLDDVCSAFLCRHRCAGHHVPLRRFRVGFDSCHHWNHVHVNQWLSYVLRHSSQELHLDLRFWTGPICKRHDDDDDGEEKEADSGSDNTQDGEPDYKPMLRWRSYVLPRRLFTCTVIRTLRVAYCRLKLPAAVNLPFLETLSITTPSYCDGWRSIQRLITSCPRLVDLTLEAVHQLKRVSVLDKRLRRFALRCCHNLKSVDIDASELRSLNPFVHGRPLRSSKAAEFDGFRRFMEKISDAKHLHLHHQSLECSLLSGFPLFSSLTRLVLQGSLSSCATVVSVGRVLQQTPNLEVLSLYMEKGVADKEKDDSEEDYVDEYEHDAYEEEEDVEEEDVHENGIQEQDTDEEEEDIDEDVIEEDEDDADNGEDGAVGEEENDLPIPPNQFVVPDESSFSMPCLRHRVKEINMVHYHGDRTQRMMAKLLFRNALVLERMCIVLVRGRLALQSKLKNEIESWVVTDAEKIFL
ncbi:unnamed protein product [Alopecurus aequalis]